ncbi:MAG: serine hydrolase [Bacteroidota bacterium]
MTIRSIAMGEEEEHMSIWYDGASYYEALNTSKYITLYFDSWDMAIPEFLKKDEFKVAYKLDRKLDPIPNDRLDLPPIDFLAAVNDDLLVSSYLSFLENYSRTQGFNYLVLPDTSGLSSYEKEVLKLASKNSPYFFIEKTNLSFSLPSSKKELDTSYAPIWIANQTDDIAKLSRLNKKVTKKTNKNFHKELLAHQKDQFRQIDQVPPSLLRQLFIKGATAIDPQNNLPITSDTVIYLGANEKLRQRLSQYVRVYDKPQVANYPVIVDNRENKRKLYGNEIVIDFLDRFHSGGKAALLLAGATADDDIIISKMLFGSQEIPGRTHLTGNRPIPSFGYLSYSELESEGVSDSLIWKMDSLINYAISNHATPGCQVVVVKNGAVILQKAFGHFTYDSLRILGNDVLFDLASLTKVSATLPAIAWLIDQGKISLNDSIGKFLPSFIGSNKSGVTIKQLLAHHGGLLPYVPFWRMALTGDRLNAFYYHSKEDEQADRRTYGLAMHPGLKDSLTNWIIKSRLAKEPDKYHYSDIGFMILHLIAEAVSGQSLDQLLTENFYAPMNLRLTFNPIQKGYSYEKIAPTEYDELYRNGQIWGEVHDRNAHVFGGVAGHAGLFANAIDVAKLMHMYLNNGYYGGRQYLSREVLDALNLRYFEDNRRGLGWDKKGEKDAASIYAGDQSFGHTGFTGTMVWADPEEDLIFVFLSNRIYPSANNMNLLHFNTRTEIHDVIYESLLDE